MEAVQFKAQYDPKTGYVNVMFKAKGHRHIELMSVVQFNRFCQQLDEKMVISGYEIKIHEDFDSGARQTLIDYFRRVQEALKDYLKRQGEG